MKYIDAEKLKEIIDKTWRELSDKNTKNGGGILDAEIYTYLSVLNVIDSLQQESIEVDLEKEIDKYCEPIQAWQIQEAPYTSLEKCAKHFFELGLKAKKEK